MAKRKKKAQPVAMRQEDTGKMVIKVKDSKVPWGHFNRISGTGRHSDSRFKRRRTRGALRQNALNDQ